MKPKMARSLPLCFGEDRVRDTQGGGEEGITVPSIILSKIVALRLWMKSHCVTILIKAFE